MIGRSVENVLPAVLVLTGIVANIFKSINAVPNIIKSHTFIPSIAFGDQV